MNPLVRLLRRLHAERPFPLGCAETCTARIRLAAEAEAIPVRVIGGTVTLPMREPVPHLWIEADGFRVIDMSVAVDRCGDVIRNRVCGEPPPDWLYRSCWSARVAQQRIRRFAERVVIH